MTSTNDDCIINHQQHWDAAFSKNTTEKLGWYEKKSQQTLDLIAKTNLPKDATILNVGNGSSTLIDDLLQLEYSNIIATDISEKALASSKERLGDFATKVDFVVDDLTNPSVLSLLKNIDLWNDRAVLHFFLSEEEKKSYVDLMIKVLKPKGYAIIATFALEGHDTCCGLPLQRYDAEKLQELLGDNFELKETFNYTFMNPYGGERPYVYTLFQKI
jgi:SAM-dependent methyltransferase